ncbi:MAG: helix-turn-helix transcriptional regulator [Calditrichaeota bacterium]|nr:helix-turn-helix transcriptional regulator [Calditrichota bacterium]
MITPQLDLFSVFIFLGAMQGLYLTFFFVFRKEGNHLSNILFGCILLVLALITLDIFSGYTNYIIYFMHLNNSTEPFTFLIGPLFYLYVFSIINDQGKLTGKQKLHFLAAIIFALNMIPYFLQPEAYKYNEFLGAFHPEAQQIPLTTFLDPDPAKLRNNIVPLIFIHVFSYVILCIRILYPKFRQQNLSFFSMQNKTLAWLRLLVLGLALAMIIFIVVRILFDADLGDYITATYTSIMLYSISFMVTKDSGFFSGKIAINNKKYEKSSLTSDMQKAILEKLNKLMEEQKPFLDSSISLSSLAKHLSISTHNLSQILNESLQKSFFEYIAEYRIAEARKMLRDPEMANMVIEEIAERVGYNSKSAFNNAFKKLTGSTPSEYRG